MPLQKQLIEVPLSAGLDQKSDNRIAQSGEALTMQNLVRLKTGAVRKRFGHTALPNADTLIGIGTMRWGGQIWSTGAALCMVGDSQTRFGGGTTAPQILYTFSDALGQWAASGLVAPGDVLDRQTLATFPGNPQDFDVVQGTNGVVLFVALVENALYWACYDGSGANPSYAIIQALTDNAITFTSGGIAPRLCVCGNTAILTYVVDANTVKCQSLNLANVVGGWSAASTLTLFGAGSQAASLAAGVYDIAPVDGDATRFCMVFEKALTNSVVLAIYSTTAPFAQGTLKVWEAQANYNTFASMCVQATSAGRYWVGYVATAGSSVGLLGGVLRANFWNETGNITGVPASFVSVSAGTKIGKCGTCVTSVATQQVFVFSTGYASGAVNYSAAQVTIGLMQDSSGTCVVGNRRQTSGVQLASRPIHEDRLDINGEGGIVMAVYVPSSLQGTHFTTIANCSTSAILQPLSCVAPRLSRNLAAHFTNGINTNLPRMFNMQASLGSGEVYAFAMAFSTETFHQSVAMQFVELGPTRTPMPADRSGQTLLAASTPYTFDGQFMQEPNFLAYPELGTVTPSTSGGSMAAGAYQYIAIWESYDALGNLHQSATSPPVTATVASGSTGSVSLVVPCPPLSFRVDNSQLVGSTQSGAAVPPARAVLYRTTAGGTIFYRATSDPAPTANIATTGAGLVTLTDTQSDTTLTASATAQLLYTAGGVLDHFNPPASRCIVLHKSRWFLAGCDEPRQVWPSDPFISGVCPGWNEAISFLATGAVRALASLDDKLVMFVQRGQAYGIEYVTGDGPNNLGTQSDWSPPQQVQSDSGAVDQRATCATPFGVLYRSNVGGPNGSGGIFLLGRDLTVQYLSGPVEDLLAAFPVVTSMVLHPNAGRVYITCVANDYATPLVGIRLVWDYIQRCWSEDTVSDVDQAQVGTAGARSACVAQTASGPTYHWLSATGRVYRETNGVGTNAYTDAGTWITAKYVSAWLKPAIAGFARFWGVEVLGDALDPADFTVQLTYDYAPSSYYQESHTWTAAQIATFDRAPQLNIHLTPGNQKAEAIQVTLTDATPTGATATTGQGASWSTLSLELGVKDGAYRNIPPAQRA